MRARARLALITAALVLIATAGCTSTPPGQQVATGASHVAADATRGAKLTTPDGVTVDIPATSLKGNGELSVTPTTLSSGVNAYAIKLTGGASLIGKATLTFAHKMSKGEAAPFIAYNENPDSPLVPVSGIKVTSTGASVTTTHFSNWLVAFVSDVIKGMTSGVNAILSATESAGQPTCSDEAKARSTGLKVTSSNGNRVHWCVGLNAAGKTEAKFTNARNYPIVVNSTPGLKLENPDTSLIAPVTKFTGALPVLAPGDSVAVLGPGQTYNYELTGTTAQTLDVRPSVGGYLASVVVIFVEVGLFLITKKPIGVAATVASTPFKKLVAALGANVSCGLPDYKLATAKLNNATDVANVIGQGMKAVGACLVPAMVKSGLVATGAGTLGALVALVISAAIAVANGAVGAADTLSNYDLTLTPPPPPLPSCQAGYVMTEYAPTATGWALACDLKTDTPLAADDPNTGGLKGQYEQYTIRIHEPGLDETYTVPFYTGQGAPCAANVAQTAGACLDNHGQNYVNGDSPESSGAWDVIESKVVHGASR